MSANELVNLFAEALEIEPAGLNLDSKISEYPEWNSLGWLTIMSMVDERFNVQLSAPEIRGFKTVREVADAISKKVELAN